MAELELVHVQLDELWGDVKYIGQDVWVWIASDVQTKLIPVMRVGGRTQEAAYEVVHELKGRLQEGCVPVFSTDGLMNYFYSLTAHFGYWEPIDRKKKKIWVVLSTFVNGWVMMFQRKRKLIEVERQVIQGEKETYQEQLKEAGLGGQVNTLIVQRVNLSARQEVSKLTRRTWGLAQYAQELMEHLECWRTYYHFPWFHESLEVELAFTIPQKGEQQPQRYRWRTPAMAVGLTFGLL